ncbi:MAG TPA: hypothetical protein VJO12_04775 [Stellaceae bacterium]|nr:hypothetical protein [Stellaceae bacterium]
MRCTQDAKASTSGTSNPILTPTRHAARGSDVWNRVTRANASRREFIGDGLPAERIARVVGLADEDPLVPDEPTSPRNRRISIVLLRAAKETPPPAASH